MALLPAVTEDASSPTRTFVQEDRIGVAYPRDSLTVCLRPDSGIDNVRGRSCPRGTLMRVLFKETSRRISRLTSCRAILAFLSRSLPPRSGFRRAPWDDGVPQDSERSRANQVENSRIFCSFTSDCLRSSA